MRARTLSATLAPAFFTSPASGAFLATSPPSEAPAWRPNIASLACELHSGEHWQREHPACRLCSAVSASCGEGTISFLPKITALRLEAGPHASVMQATSPAH